MKRHWGMLFVTLAACGGAPGSAPANAPAPAPTSADPAPSAAPTPKAGPTIESQREPFMQSCMREVHAPDYCECAFGQFREVFQNADLSADLDNSDPRLAQLQEKTLAACASKLDEPTIKTNFMRGCTGDDAKKQSYCGCAWGALRKELSLTDFLGNGKDARFQAAQKSMVVACKGKLPAKVVKQEFMQGCTAKHPDGEARCACLWKKLAAKYSVEELAAGMVDVASVPGLADCGKK
jgi:hypothetical protein